MNDCVQWQPHDDSAALALDELQRKFEAQVTRLDENERACATAENARATAEAERDALKRTVAAYEAADSVALAKLTEALVKCSCSDSQCPVCMLIYDAMQAIQPAY